MKGPVTSTQLALLCQRAERGAERGLKEEQEGSWGGGSSWVPYPEAKNLPSLCSATSPRPSTHTRELKIPFTLTGARSWLEKARDKKRFSTEQNHYNGPALIWAPTLSTPTSANWTLSPCNCHPRRESPHTLNEAIHSNLLQTVLWTVSEKSSSIVCTFWTALSSPSLIPFLSLASFKWASGQRGQSSRAVKEKNEH